MVYINPDHPLISSVCPLLSAAFVAVGIVMLPLVLFGHDWARKAAALCGFGVLLPLATGIGLMYGKHWHFDFRAMAPDVALSADGTAYRDGCRLKAGELEAIREVYPPSFYYTWYALIGAIVAVGKFWDWYERRSQRLLLAIHAERLARQAEMRRRP